MVKVYEELKSGLIKAQKEIMQKIGEINNELLNLEDKGTSECVSLLMDVYRNFDSHILRIDRKLNNLKGEA